MQRQRFYLSTIDSQAGTLARAHGLGVEIAQFCTAWNLDEHFQETDAALEKTLAGASRRVLHGPFNELFPCAIDPKARQLAKFRYQQAIDMARRYGADKVILHGGYNPWLYYPVWYQEQSVAFWKDFDIPEGITVCLENVLEPEPDMLVRIVREVDNPQLRLCLDVGHVNAYSQVPVVKWLEDSAEFVRHFHIHNNFGDKDSHRNLQEGTIPMKALLESSASLCPQATVTLEIPEGEPSVKWLEEYIFEGGNGYGNGTEVPAGKHHPFG